MRSGGMTCIVVRSWEWLDRRSDSIEGSDSTIGVIQPSDSTIGVIQSNHSIHHGPSSPYKTKFPFHPTEIQPQEKKMVSVFNFNLGSNQNTTTQDETGKGTEEEQGNTALEKRAEAEQAGV